MKLTKPIGMVLSLVVGLMLGLATACFAETDVTSKVQVVKSPLSYDRVNKQSYLNVSVKNISNDVLMTPVTVVVDSVSPSTVTVANADGVFEDGKPYLDMATTPGQFLPGATITAKKLIFANPSAVKFSYTIKVLASTPVLSKVIGTEGGIINLVDPITNSENISVKFPPGILPNGNVVSVNYPKSTPPPRNGEEVVSETFEILSPVHSFTSPVEITIPYKDDDNDGIVDSTNAKVTDIKGYVFDDNAKKWDEANLISRNQINKTITFATYHFSPIQCAAPVAKKNDFVRIFTIDGLNFGNTFLPKTHANARDAYLSRTLLNNLNIDNVDFKLSAADIYSFVQDDCSSIQLSSWSGDAKDTYKIIEDLVIKMKEQFDIAKKENKKFIIVTHSWGTVLGHLALSYADISPDLFITLSSPLGSDNVTKYGSSIFYPPLLWSNIFKYSSLINLINTTAGVQKTIKILTNANSLLATQVMDKKGIKKDYTVGKWLNVWEDGDVISGPLSSQFSKFALDFEDLNHSFYSNRTVKETSLSHAITTLDDQSMLEQDVDIKSANVMTLKLKIWSALLYFNGNPLDSDEDGIHPFLDKCPKTPIWEAVDADGCSASQLNANLDNDGDGFKPIDGDCNDNEPAMHPNTVWYQDADGDGYGDGTTRIQCLRGLYYNKLASELISLETDCDDNDPAVGPSTWYADSDGDGFGNPNVSTLACGQPTGYVSNNTDCNDSNASIHPGVTEIPGDGIDQDCSGTDQVPDVTPGTFTATGSMKNIRYHHTATLLPDGKVLVAGGVVGNETPVPQAELYDPQTGTFSTTGSLNVGRFFHRATKLQNDKVLITGGYKSINSLIPVYFNSAEIYDPATGVFQSTGNMNFARRFHTSTLLGNGMVLITGGTGAGDAYLDSAELFDPATNKFTLLTSKLSAAIDGHTATLLDSGKVLIVGGNGKGIVASYGEIYDPATGVFSKTGNMVLGRGGHTSVKLLDGKVLVTGGSYNNMDWVSPTISELYDPSTNSFAPTGSIRQPRTTGGSVSGAEVTLPNGNVLIAGGGYFDKSSNLWTYRNSAEIYNHQTGLFSDAAPMSIARVAHSVTMLENGKVLVAGGIERYSGSNGLSSAELFTP